MLLALAANTSFGGLPVLASLLAKDNYLPHMFALVTLHAVHRSLGPPIAGYVRDREQEDPHRRVVVIIPEVQPEHWWRWFLHNQRGAVLSRVITSGTDNVVICRLRFRLARLAPDEEPGTVPAERA